MAKTNKPLAVFTQTEPTISATWAKPEKPKYKAKHTRNKADPSEQRGIGLRKSEWAHMGEIAAELDESINGLAAWALRDFMRRWDTGERPPTEPRNVLKRD